jgi:putative transposase
MPRNLRTYEVGSICHVINRAVLRYQIFNSNEDYKDFMDIIHEAREAVPTVKILAFCLMPNHWHFLLQSGEEGDISKFMHILTVTHTVRMHKRSGTVGMGPLYQGRYKSFLVEREGYLKTVLKYIECNALRANLVLKAEAWPWGSAFARISGSYRDRSMLITLEAMEIWVDYAKWLNDGNTEDELTNLRHSIKKGLPYGRPSWVERMIDVHGLESTTRGVGRPKKIL